MSEMAKNVGHYGTYAVGAGLAFRVRITDARERFGETDYLVVPADGIGQKWVASHKIKVSEYCVAEGN